MQDFPGAVKNDCDDNSDEIDVISTRNFHFQMVIIY